MTKAQTVEFLLQCLDKKYLEDTQGFSKNDFEKLKDNVFKIIKDLEILEMLKKEMTFETDYYDSDFGCEMFEYIAYNGEALYIDSQEEFNLLKEWIKNDK